LTIDDWFGSVRFGLVFTLENESLDDFCYDKKRQEYNRRPHGLRLTLSGRA